MKLTRYPTYALCAIQLAALKASGLMGVDDVGKIHGFAAPHITKILYALGKISSLITRCGRGGFALSRPPEEIIGGDMMRITAGLQEFPRTVAAAR